ncbi:trigger factor [Sedimenticola thiotaurini]|uniref:Trigger factor n=1 Tax=Sedimenticola thiotaurini TaxID=1543721 RepID=A0A0F7JX77_9GAMM|nr:trigger factor [Sedimenticola thiotaurini]AKH20232.1 trigger factor [Sedimenticola thiotaurini]
MQVSVESSEGLERRMTVELPAEKVNQAVEKRLKEIARTVRLDGFRPGKVPLSVVRKRFSNDAKQEVFGDLVQSSYFEALMQEKLNPAGEPSIEPVEKAADEGLAYVAVFEVMPEVSLNPLGDATVQRPVVEVTDDDLNNMVEKLRKQRVTWSEVDRAAQEGDQVTVNFKGYIDGEAFEGGSADGVPLELGSHGMIEGFEEGLVGAKAGESRTLELTFPEDYRAEHLAGKPAKFEVEVTKVSESVLPEVNEEFIKAFGIKEDGVEGFYREIRANMTRELEDKIRNQVKEQAMDALLEANKLDVPKALVKREAEVLLQQTKANLAQGGQGNNINLPVELFEDQAKKRVTLGLIIAEVVSSNSIEVDEDRVRQRIEEFAQTYEEPQQVIDYYYGNKEQLSGIQNLVLEDQVVDWVLDQVKVEDVTKTFDEVMNPAAPDAEAADE